VYPLPRSRVAVLALTAGLSLILVAPVAGFARESVLVMAPVAAPSWDETSGYGSVEASRAAASAALAPDPSWDTTSGYGAVEASRAER
jgi:hypothetical protein